MGVIADLSSTPDPAQPRLKDRAFAPIGRECFDAVLSSANPSETTRRGLSYLVSKTETSERLQIKVLNATKREIYRDLVRASEFDQSAIFKLVHDNVFGVHEPSPFALLVTDWELDSTPADVELMEKMSQVAAAIHAPFVSAVGPAFFLADNFEELAKRPHPWKIFENPHYAKWRSFRKSEDARYVGLTCGATQSAWAFAANVARAFQVHRWYAAIQGPMIVEDGMDYGLMMNATLPDGTILFPRAAAVFEPTAQESPKATEEFRRAVELPYVFGISRFAHYVKALVGDRNLPFDSPENCEQCLNEWISRYVATGGPSSEHPLTSAHIRLEKPGAPSGSYRAVIRANPAFQLPPLMFGPRVVASLPPGKIR